jgi:hypothetical protein
MPKKLNLGPLLEPLPLNQFYFIQIKDLRPFQLIRRYGEFKFLINFFLVNRESFRINFEAHQ